MDGTRLACVRLLPRPCPRGQALERHLGGVAALMENHFRYEERHLLTVLETLDLDADPRDALGPL
jgi:hypothetical protein